MTAGGRPVTGTNVVSIIPGTSWGTADDRVIIVGAHWDTVVDSPGFDDNASGTAAVLEVARALSMAHCVPRYTVVLALFDLEEYGTQGSMAFVQDFLVPAVLQKMGFPGVQGAYIVDSIMSYNDTVGSQAVPGDYAKYFPAVAREIKKEGSRGDFISVLGRAEEDELMSRFRHHWKAQVIKYITT